MSTPYTKDVEQGHPGIYTTEPNGQQQNLSLTSLSAGIGAALSSNASSIHGDPDAGPGSESEWGPSHPCYPHLNPHVPIDSALYSSTRVIRIRRDWMLAGDLAPTFSYMYPEILADAGLGEGEFRTVIEDVNRQIIPAFAPYGLRNVVDAVLGLLTGWIWDDLGWTATKSRLSALERSLERWNERLASENSGAGVAAKFLPLRRSAYMTLDIQIPTPQIGEIDDDEEDARTATSRHTER